MAIKESTFLIIRIIIIFFVIIVLLTWGIFSYDLNTKEGFLILIGGATGAFLSTMMQDIIRYGERRLKK